MYNISPYIAGCQAGSYSLVVVCLMECTTLTAPCEVCCIDCYATPYTTTEKLPSSYSLARETRLGNLEPLRGEGFSGKTPPYGEEGYLKFRVGSIGSSSKHPIAPSQISEHPIAPSPFRPHPIGAKSFSSAPDRAFSVLVTLDRSFPVSNRSRSGLTQNPSTPDRA